MKLDFNNSEVKKIKENPYYIEKAFKKRNITFKPEDALIISKATLRLNLRTIHFSPVSAQINRSGLSSVNVLGFYGPSSGVLFDQDRH
jgi:hypothetical protein